MMNIDHLEVTALIEFAPLSRDADPLDSLSIHQLRLSTLSEEPETLTYAIENHLAEHLDTYTLAPDESDESISFTIYGSDQAPIYAADVSLHSRSLEPAVACEQWGIGDVADHLGIAAVTIRAYNNRSKMPAPDGHIAGSPWWNADRIRAWKNIPSKGRRKSR